MNAELTVLLTGDFHTGGRINSLVENTKFNEIYNDFLPVLKGNDLNITNLESPLTYSDTQIKKTGPAIKSDPKAIGALEFGNFNLVTLANNHILDYGRKGLEDTLRLCHESGIKTVGAGTSIDEINSPYYFKKGKVSLAIINVTENEFSTIPDNKASANPFNLITIYNSIKETKLHATHTLLIIHGGHENYRLPSPRMKSAYRFFAEAGADIIVGHHPHCFSGFERFKKSIIFYSLGNFIFDKTPLPDENWSTGYAIKLSLNSDSFDYELIPYKQNNESAGVHRMNEIQNTLFYDHIKALNDIIGNDDKLLMEFERHCAGVKKRYESFLEPYSDKLLHYLRTIGFFPSFFSGYKRRLLLNLIRCESHREIVEFILSSNDRNS